MTRRNPPRTAPADGPPKELERSPEARTYSVEQLLHLVRDGKVRIPRFQRGLKWTVDDARDLLDSIYRGYPIGTLLLWQRPGQTDQLEYGTVKIEAPEMTDALWVVDGQQRVTSLVRVLLGQGLGREDFALYFDTANQRFFAPKRNTDIPGTAIPLTEAADSERLLEWLFAHPHADRRRVIYLGKRIREYQMPAYLVTTAEEDAVREIYRRTNSTGKQMKPADVFDAIHGARGEAAPADLRGVSDSLAGLGFGRIDDDLLYRMMLATRGTDVRKRSVPELGDGEAQALISGIERVARSVIAFLRRDAGIPHVDFVPYRLPLIPLARFFHLHPEPSPRSRELLSRWLWRGAVTGLHDGDALLTTPKVLKLIAGDEAASVQGLLSMVWKSGAWDPSIYDFSIATARGKVMTLALYALGPRHLQTGAPLDIQPHRPLYGTQHAGDMPELVRSLANRLIHPPVAGGLHKALARVTDMSLLASHGFPEDAASLIREYQLRPELRDKLPVELLLERTEALARAVEAFVERKTRWEETDRPPLAALIVADDEDDQ